MINNSNIELLPMSNLIAIVKNDLSKWDAEGFIDEGRLIKTVMQCNERLGLSVREIREIALPVNEFECDVPLDLEKLFYVCALKATNTMVSGLKNPFDNSFDSDIIYDAHLDKETLGGVDNYQVIIKRESNVEVHQYGSWIQLDIDKSSDPICHIDCPNTKKKGKYSIQIKNGKIITPFRSGMLYIMYVGSMKDREGNITFPFHPMITPYYEATIKEEILSDMLFNSDANNISELYKLAEQQRKLAWIDAFNFSTEKEYGYYVNLQKKKELGWYHQYFRYFQ